MAILRSATKKDPSILRSENDATSPEKSLCHSNPAGVPPTIGSSSSLVEATPPDSAKVRKEIPSVHPFEYPGAPSSRRKSLRFASKPQEFSSHEESVSREVRQCREGGAGDEESPHHGPHHVPASPVAECTDAAAGEEGKRRFMSDEPFLSPPRRRRSLRDESSQSRIDGWVNRFDPANSEQTFLEKDESEIAREAESDWKQKIVENERRRPISIRKFLAEDDVGTVGQPKADVGSILGKKRVESSKGDASSRKTRRSSRQHASETSRRVDIFGDGGADVVPKLVNTNPTMESIDLIEPDTAGDCNGDSQDVDLARPDTANYVDEQNEELHAVEEIGVQGFDRGERSTVNSEEVGMEMESASELVVEQNSNEEMLESRRIRSEQERLLEYEWRVRSNHSFARGSESADDLKLNFWPGPYSTAREISRLREVRRAARAKTLEKHLDTSFVIDWIPSRQTEGDHVSRTCPSLGELSRMNLCEHIQDVVSLDGIPDECLIEIGNSLCASRRMNSRVFELILAASHHTVSIPDCSNVTEEELEKVWFRMQNLHQLRVLHLDLAGRCMSDNFLHVACSSQTFSCLTSLSLKGAYRLTDDGLCELVNAASALESINLSDCTSLTEAGIYELTVKLLLSLKELYIDGCQQLDARAILDPLLNLKKLEVLSAAGIQSVDDIFVSKLVSVHGLKLKTLILADCRELSDVSVGLIGRNCPMLCTLNLTNMSNLTDGAMSYLAESRRPIQVLAINRCLFSDEAISAYLEVCGKSLTELSVYGIREVAHNTALSISSCCRKRLLRLDLSWCRKLTDEALGLIADSCQSLQELRLFGCTQLTSTFLDGYSNLKLKIVGLRDSCLIPKTRVSSAKITFSSTKEHY